MTNSGATSAGGTDPAEDKASGTSLGGLLSEVLRDMSTLFRQEVALAKAEITDSGKKAGKGAGMFGGAGVAGHFVLLFLSLALWMGLADLIENLGWAAVIVAVIWAIIAIILALQGKKEFQKINGAPQTAETIKEIPETFK